MSGIVHQKWHEKKCVKCFTNSSFKVREASKKRKTDINVQGNCARTRRKKITCVNVAYILALRINKQTAFQSYFKIVIFNLFFHFLPNTFVSPHIPIKRNKFLHFYWA